MKGSEVLQYRLYSSKTGFLKKDLWDNIRLHWHMTESDFKVYFYTVF